MVQIHPHAAKDFINKDVTSTSRSGKVILDLSDQEDSESAVDLNSKSLQKKRVKHVDIEQFFTVLVTR